MSLKLIRIIENVVPCNKIHGNRLLMQPCLIHNSKTTCCIGVKKDFLDFACFCSSFRFRCFTPKWSRIHKQVGVSNQDKQHAYLLSGSERWSGVCDVTTCNRPGRSTVSVVTGYAAAAAVSSVRLPMAMRLRQAATTSATAGIGTKVGRSAAHEEAKTYAGR